MNDHFKRFIPMLFLCNVGISFAHNANMAMMPAPNIMMATTNLAHHNLNLFNSKEEQLIKKCLTFEPLQAIIPASVKSQMKHFHILSKDINMLSNTNFKVEGKSVSLINKSEINLKKTYFFFNTLSIANDRAMVEYDFVFLDKDAKKSIAVTIEFERQNAVWEAYNYHTKIKAL